MELGPLVGGRGGADMVGDELNGLPPSKRVLGEMDNDTGRVDVRLTPSDLPSGTVAFPQSRISYAGNHRMELTQPSAGPSVSQADRITSAAISLHTYLPRHGKPIIRSNGIPEWTVLSALILSTPTRLIPVSLGTGVKVLPANRLPPLGDVVHDCHAEILARRGMVRWLLAEALRVVRGERDEGVLELRHGKFGYKPGVEVWMYVSTLPVGMRFLPLPYRAEETG